MVVADKNQHTSQIQELFWEYLEWGNAKIKEEFNANFDTALMVKTDMKDLEKFMPPNGCLLLCYVGNDLAGIGCLKQVSPLIGELKRMYVRPGFRKAGLGRVLVNRLLEEARNIGYQFIRLDSPGFSKEAHRLYWSFGFKEVSAYEESEIPQEFQRHWLFMELPLIASKV